MSVWPGPPDENSWIHACFFTKWLIQIFHWDYGSNWYLSFKYLCFSQVSDMFCCLLYQQLQSVDNIFQSILFKHTKWHFIGTCTNKQSQKYHQIDFKGFFFSLKYFFLPTKQQLIRPTWPRSCCLCVNYKTKERGLILKSAHFCQNIWLSKFRKV